MRENLTFSMPFNIDATSQGVDFEQQTLTNKHFIKTIIL